MMTTVEIWNRLIDDFVARHRRDRCHVFLSSAKRRDELVDELYSSTLFDERYLHRLNAPETPEAVDRMMTKRGAGDTVLELTPRGSADGAWMPRRAALERWVGLTDDILLYCPVGRVAYYESHHPGERYLLFRD